MKKLVISDIHGRPLEELEDVFGEIDSLICLGDFDHPRNVEEFMDIQERLNKEGKEVIIVPGNHDHAIFYNFPIHSGTLYSNGWDVEGLHQELTSNYPRAKEFMQSLLENDGEELIEHGIQTNIFGLPAYAVHGGLAGDLSSCGRCPKSWEDLWFRIRWSYNPMENFEKMEERGYDFLLRGHDHNRMYLTRDSEGKFQGVQVLDGGTIPLAKGDKHFVSPGPWFNGNYLVLDEDERTLYFRDAGEWE